MQTRLKIHTGCRFVRADLSEFYTYVVYLSYEPVLIVRVQHVTGRICGGERMSSESVNVGRPYSWLRLFR